MRFVVEWTLQHGCIPIGCCCAVYRPSGLWFVERTILYHSYPATLPWNVALTLPCVALQWLLSHGVAANAIIVDPLWGWGKNRRAVQHAVVRLLQQGAAPAVSFEAIFNELDPHLQDLADVDTDIAAFATALHEALSGRLGHPDLRLTVQGSGRQLLLGVPRIQRLWHRHCTSRRLAALAALCRSTRLDDNLLGHVMQFV